MVFTIRKGQVADLPKLHELVMKLATFEKAPERVISNPKSYETDFLENWFDFLVAEVEGKVVGIALYFKAYSTWRGKSLYLDDLYVEEDYRKSGIGKALIQEYLNIAKQMNTNLAWWQVLDWNKNAVEMYEKMGAVLDEEWINCKIDLV